MVQGLCCGPLTIRKASASVKSTSRFSRKDTSSDETEGTLRDIAATDRDRHSRPGHLGPPVQAGMITGIVSFGDSLSDVGNTYLAAGMPPSPPYYKGHYSNGPIWLEIWLPSSGSPRPRRAWRGDWTTPGEVPRPATGCSFMGTPNIGLQISTFLASNTPSSTQLITIWGGANDFLNAGVVDPTTVVNNLASEITTLANAGGKLFMVPNLPLLGDTPAVMAQGPAAVAGMNALSMRIRHAAPGGAQHAAATTGNHHLPAQHRGLVPRTHHESRRRTGSPT